jgi:predicted dehydrogenase
MTHRVLVIGVGSIGERHLRCFQTTGRAQVTLCELNPSLRQSIAERYQVTAFSDLDAAMADRPTAAVIATPAPLHIPMALKLAEAGVHLLIEKPLSTRLDDVDRLQQLVSERKVTVMVGYVYRSHPGLTAMRSALLSGRFGRPVQLASVCGQHFPTYRPAYRSNYYHDRKTGGGAIQDALTHLVNAGEWLVGPVTRLVADCAHQVLEGVTVEDTVNLLTRHGESVLGSYCLNQHQAPNEVMLSVICERGTVRFEYHKNRWRWLTEPGGAWHDEPFGPSERDTIYIAQAQAFLNAVEGRGPVTCTLAEGVQTLRVNLAALASADGAGWQTIA